MSLFGCKGCAGRDQEIRHLMAELERVHGHLEKAQARICELAEPGTERRIAALEKRDTQPLPRPRKTPDRYGFPGYDSLPIKTGDKVEVS